MSHPADGLIDIKVNFIIFLMSVCLFTNNSAQNICVRVYICMDFIAFRVQDN